MGITWCRERLEQAQNSKNPVDRILIRCSNVIKPKNYSRSQDRLADDIVYRGVRSKEVCSLPSSHLHLAPPRTRNRLRGMSDWHSCALTGHATEDLPAVAPIPPPRKKRKRKTLGETLPPEPKSLEPANKENSNQEHRKQNRFVKLSENRSGKTKPDIHASSGGKEKPKSDRKKKKVVKTVSSVSLPNYSDLVKKPEGKPETERKRHPAPRRNQSTISLPGEGSSSVLSSLSEATIHRLETYMKRCRSFGSLKPQQLLEKLEELNKTNKSASESSDSWSGLDDWDMGVIEYCDPEIANDPPLMPKSRLPPRNKIFSVGTPQETPRRQSPVSEEEAPERSLNPILPEESGAEESVLDSIMTEQNVPSDWFSDAQKTERVGKTPPPSPANGPADTSDKTNDLAEALSKYEEPVKEPAKPKRNRSNSLMDVNLNLLHVERYSKRSPSIGLEKTTRLLDELAKSGEAIELLSNSEQVLNGLRRASLYENLPEDPFEIYIRRKKPSLRESLTEFLGFQAELAKKEEKKEDDPPPLPINPPPMITMNPPEDSTSYPLVIEDDLRK